MVKRTGKPFREVYEETKLQVQPFILYDTWEFFHEDFQITGVIYLVEMPEGGEIELSDEHEEYRFLPLEKESLNVMDIVFLRAWNAGILKQLKVL